MDLATGLGGTNVNFSTRLTLYYLTATLLSLALVGLAILKGIEHYGMAAVEKQLIEQSESAAVYVTQTLLLEKLGPDGLSQIAVPVTNSLSAGNREVRIYDQRLNLLATGVDGVQQITGSQGQQQSKHLTPALQGNYAYLLQNNTVYFATPLELRGEIIGLLEFVYPLDFLNQVLSSSRNILYAGALGFGLLITLLSISIARKVVQPIRQLVAATNRFAQRDFTPVRLQRKDELGQLARSFTDMGSELQHYIQRQRQFVANVSHELRTPLTAIKGYSEYLIDEVKGRPDLEKAVYHLNNESARLHRLVNELLLLSRIDAGREDFQFSPLDLSQVIRQSLDKLQTRLAKYQINMRVQIQPAVMVSGDGEKLVQAMINLLDNSIKFSPPGGDVTVELATAQGMARLTVADRGVGIPPEDLERIFDRFYRAANARSVGGTGLGLAITKEIITAHGGTIQLRNRARGGTEAVVLLPLA